MENRSQNNQNRRQSGNRSGGRNRNRQGNQSKSGDGGSNGRTRNRNRSGSSRASQVPKQTLGQKILSILTFGLLGKPKSKAQAKSVQKPDAPKQAPKSAPARNRDADADRPKRARNEVTSGRLYVGNLDYSTGEPELEELFRGVGNVVSAEAVTNPRTQQSKGFAFVVMGSIAEAKRAVSVLDDKDFMGRKLIVSGARSEGPHDDESAMAESSSGNQG